MDKKHNNLIWVILSSVLLLNVVVLCCDTVYAEQISKNNSMPLPAVFVISAQNNIYPWSAKEVVAAEKTIVAKEAEVEKEIKAEVKKATKVAKSTKVVAEGEIGPGVETKVEPASAAAPKFQTAGIEYFNDACFIGDSFTEGITIYSQIPNADFYGIRGVSTSNVFKKDVKLPNGGTGTLEQALAQKQYGKIYILLGINEVGNNDPAGYAARYADIIARIKALQPNAIIFVQSILHTTQNKSDNSMFKNSYINAYNTALEGLADNKNVFYINLNPLFDDANGALRSDISGDGVHLKAPQYIVWRDYLLQHAIIPVSEEKESAAA